ncbi:hypothetical protein GCM10011375_33700 [Hymenobacter qilianensis]|uniref:Uncharacterized protein n=2 Tax=Hymenobacter qilianensis TaxID=1385715 RepID=A0ACB5PVM5_9BACT|nr:hypothetical protein [Hymenobacter qilianensis]QNP51366.1 hypothetical protein H9L05_15150 [Hymenobacter qilianensis]GGF75936.1 hypothetical protein GCM10011375_33700 [Hymenobacter qilianensis]
MPNESLDPVFQLIKSLTRTEKRHFRLFTNRQGSNEGLKFLQLFDALDEQERYDEERVLSQVPAIKKVQLANLKANLYKQMLASLRLYHMGQNLDIQLREQLDYARVLYNRGLYQQSLKMLEKVKVAAHQAEMPHIVLLALDFEKLIEAQYITRSLRGKAENLSAEVRDTVAHLAQEHELSNLALRMYGLYIKIGHSRNQEDSESITALFRAEVAKVDLTAGGFFEKLYYYQAQVWYHTITQNFRACYRYAQKWVDLFAQYPGQQEQQFMLYLKGLHNLLVSLFNLQYYSKFNEVLQTLEALSNQPDRRTNPNTDMLLFLYVYTNRINAYFMRGRFTEGLTIIPELLDNLSRFRQQLDPHRRLVFYYKIASLYFGSGDHDKAIDYLTKVIQYKDVSLREDIQCFARILNLIAHYEAGRDEDLEYQIKSVYRFLGKMNEQQQMQVAIFQFLRSLGDVAPSQLKDAFVQLKEQLIGIAANPFERRPFLYLDIISWLESKIENAPVQEIIQRKFLLLK